MTQSLFYKMKTKTSLSLPNPLYRISLFSLLFFISITNISRIYAFHQRKINTEININMPGLRKSALF